MKTYIFILIVLSGILSPLYSFAYPGCLIPDTIIWWQMWASCNSTTKSSSSWTKSGWFFAGEKFPIYMSYNGMGQSLFPEIRNRAADIQVWPCAKWYRIPNRGEWETAILYARLANISITQLLWLPQNGGYRIYRDKEKVLYSSTENVLGSYWTSTREDIYGIHPIVLHLRSSRMSYTEPAYQETQNLASYGDDEIEMLAGEVAEIANVRCIRK